MITWLKKMWSTLVGKSLVGAGVVSVIVGTFLHDQLGELWHWTIADLTSQRALDWYAATWHWLWSPVGVPRPIVWVAFGVAVWVCLNGISRLRERWWPTRIAQVTPVELPPVGNLDAAHRRLLYTLYGHYREWRALSEIATEMNGTYGHAEQMTEFFEPMGLVETQLSSLYGMYARLTPRGRDFCIKHGLVRSGGTLAT